MAFPLSQAVAAALTLLLWAGAAAAQPSDAVDPNQPQPQEALDMSLSPECRAPTSVLYTTGSMQNVAAALASRRSLRVLALGAFPSGTFGSGPGSSKYTARLHAELEQILGGATVEVEGRRLAGEITAGAPEYVTNNVTEVNPDLVVWSAGTHDALARAEQDAFATEVREILEWLRSHAIDVIIVEPPYAAAVADDRHYTEIVQRLRAVAEEHNAPVVLRYEAMRYLSQQQNASPEQQFELHDLSRRCIPEYVARAAAASLRAHDPGQKR
jgi:acyl-CoA thioesterase-1